MPDTCWAAMAMASRHAKSGRAGTGGDAVCAALLQFAGVHAIAAIVLHGAIAAYGGGHASAHAAGVGQADAGQTVQGGGLWDCGFREDAFEPGGGSGTVRLRCDDDRERDPRRVDERREAAADSAGGAHETSLEAVSGSGAHLAQRGETAVSRESKRRCWALTSRTARSGIWNRTRRSPSRCG